MSVIKARPVTTTLAEVGESPLFLGREHVVVWVDLLSGTLFVTDTRTSATVTHDLGGRVVGLVRACVDGGLAIAMDRGLWNYSLDGTSLPRQLGAFDIGSELLPNDGACTPDGSLWLGFRVAGGARGGALYRLESDFTTTIALPDLGLPNGLSFSADGRSALLVDSLDRKIRRLRITPSGVIDSATTWVDLSAGEAMPDGLAMDLDGGAWVAMWGAGEVRRFDREGVLTDVIELPVSLVTACCFGEMGDLYITTSRLGVSLAEQPLAGALFVARTSHRGQRVYEFANRTRQRMEEL
jgi:sugar lactone lactonase YvrE